MTARPEWLKPTPRENYLHGVNYAFVHIRHDGREIGEVPVELKKKDRPFWGGMVAQYYGVNLMPAGRV